MDVAAGGNTQAAMPPCLEKQSSRYELGEGHEARACINEPSPTHMQVCGKERRRRCWASGAEGVVHPTEEGRCALAEMPSFLGGVSERREEPGKPLPPL